MPKLIVDAEHLNELQVDTIKRTIEKIRNSHEIDILIHKRKDAVDTYFQADWLKHMRLED
jgi:hypothetical protein